MNMIFPFEVAIIAAFYIDGMDKNIGRLPIRYGADVVVSELESFKNPVSLKSLQNSIKTILDWFVHRLGHLML